MRIYKLATGSRAASADAIANVQILRPGKILAVAWAASLVCKTDAAQYHCEISTASVNQQLVNDTPNVISCIESGSGFVTSGLALAGINLVVAPIMVPVNVGDKIYIHVVITGAFTSVCTCFLYVQE